MIDINNQELYCIKATVPDVFFCNEEGKVLYYSTFLTNFEITSPYDNEPFWTIKMDSPLGSLQSWFNLQKDIQSREIKYLYTRDFARNRETGEDKEVCMQFYLEGLKKNISQFRPDGELFTFSIMCKVYRPIEIEEYNCPRIGQDENGKYIVDANCGAIKLNEIIKNTNNTKALKRKEDKKHYI